LKQGLEVLTMTKSNNAAALLVTVSLRVHERGSAGMGRESSWSTLGDLSVRITHQRKAIPDALAAAISLGWIERVADLYATTPAGRAVVAAEQRKPRAAAAEPMERVELNPDALAILRVMGDGRERTLGDVRARLPGLKRREYIVREMRELGVIERVEPTDSIKTYIYVITSLGRAALGMAAQEITA
jgi:hypothetical protein